MTSCVVLQEAEFERCRHLQVLIKLVSYRLCMRVFHVDSPLVSTYIACTLYVNPATLFLCCAASRKMSRVTGAATEGVTDNNCYWLNFNFLFHHQLHATLTHLANIYT